MPDRTPRESVHDLNTQIRSGAGGQLHLFRSAATHTFGIPITPHMSRKDRFVPVVDDVAHGLADQVIADREYIQSVRLKHLTLSDTVAGIVRGPNHIKVIAPAGQLEAIVSPRCSLLCQFRKREIGPLACEECDGSAHDVAGGEYAAATH
jgi:hypothetical protein